MIGLIDDARSPFQAQKASAGKDVAESKVVDGRPQLGRVFSYSVTNKLILPERDAGMEQRLENARWIGHSAASNTHRLIIVAMPDQ